MTNRVPLRWSILNFAGESERNGRISTRNGNVSVAVREISYVFVSRISCFGRLTLKQPESRTAAVQSVKNGNFMVFSLLLRDRAE